MGRGKKEDKARILFKICASVETEYYSNSHLQHPAPSILFIITVSVKSYIKTVWQGDFCNFTCKVNITLCHILALPTFPLHELTIYQLHHNNQQQSTTCVQRRYRI